MSQEEYTEVMRTLRDLQKQVNEVSVKADRMMALIRPAMDKLDKL